MKPMTAKLVEFGNLRGTIYDANDVDDILPMHAHGEADVHITIVARGSFRAHGDGWEMTAKAGDVIDWKVGQAHELIALEPNSRFVNIRKGVAP
jgi:quercetin dioxygenase-like cupin family protein